MRARNPSRAKTARSTITVRLTPTQHALLDRACKVNHMSQTGYLARLAVESTREDLLRYAVRRYRAGEASLSELAAETGLDVPTILGAAASGAGDSEQAVSAFLTEAKALAKRLEDPELYEMARDAVRRSPGPHRDRGR
ncbi:MAG: hypothetical protein HY721_26820 [Planctomycetes bacterium]|nr:hypothetical protein [Planctomycetota bacterium]